MSSYHLYVASEALQFAFQLTEQVAAGVRRTESEARESETGLAFGRQELGLKECDRAYALFLATVSFFRIECAPVLWLAA
jgi:hypothetical protein